MCAACSVVGAIVYAILAEGELQSWATAPVEYVVECHKVNTGEGIVNDENLKKHTNAVFESSNCVEVSLGDVPQNIADPLSCRKMSEPNKGGKQ